MLHERQAESWVATIACKGRQFNVSRRFQETHWTLDSPRSGQPRVTTAAHDHHIKIMLLLCAVCDSCCTEVLKGHRRKSSDKCYFVPSNYYFEFDEIHHESASSDSGNCQFVRNVRKLIRS